IEDLIVNIRIFAAAADAVGPWSHINVVAAEFIQNEVAIEQLVRAGTEIPGLAGRPAMPAEEAAVIHRLRISATETAVDFEGDLGTVFELRGEDQSGDARAAAVLYLAHQLAQPV